jgi:Lung seven transmembrane receptor
MLLRILLLLPLFAYHLHACNAVTAVITTLQLQDDSALNSWAMPAFITDIIFLSWIYSALISMLERLKAANETYKLDMYTKLGKTISVSQQFKSVIVCDSSLPTVSVVQQFRYRWQ